MLRISLLLFFLVYGLGMSAQTFRLAGTITNAYSGEVVADAKVALGQGDDAVVVRTDSLGRYAFQGLAPGRYDLKVSAATFYSLEERGVLVGSGPLSNRTFSLVPLFNVDLPDVVVRSSPLAVNPLLREVQLEQVRRLPATFYDPARLLALSPGVVQTNDQANHLSVRGNSPVRNLWRIQGLAIVNPNHTANAGTITDSPSFSGGGVNAISAQLLDNSAFYAGGLPVEYGFASGGTFDVRFRPGNNQKRQHQLQAGLIGIDLATEGPIGKGDHAMSYLLNYRYSFTGILGDLGVDFGGEEIRFQDVNLHLFQPLKNGGKVSFFGLYGNSENTFRGPTMEADVTEEKELFDIDFSGDVAAIGTTFEQSLGRGQITIGAAYSELNNDRQQGPTEYFRTIDEQSRGQELFMSRLNVKADYRLSLGAHAQLQTGVEMLEEQADRTLFLNREENFASSSYDQTVVSPYLSFQLRSGAWRYSFGARYSLYGREFENNPVEPRVAITYFNGKHTLTAGLESMSRLPTLGLLSSNYVFRNPRVPLTNQLNLAWNISLPGSKRLQFAAYLQRTDNEINLIGVNGLGRQSANSLLSLPFTVNASDFSRSRSRGLEASLSKPIRRDEWYYQINATVFTAEYEDIEDEWVAGRYAQSFASRLLIGKEWSGTNRKDHQRTYGFNLAVLLNGGERTPALDIERIQNQNSPILEDLYDFRSGFTGRNATYFRPDLRLYQRIFRAKTTTTFALDIQNVAGRENDSFIAYDSFLRREVVNTQLGIIPVLSYRVEWR
ncbi:MAG: TonB-dependent receptor [Bacteroidota bacterium]